MTARFLPHTEWSRLDGTLLEWAWRHMSPTDKVLIVEDEHGAIQGCVAFIQQWHLEGAWIAPTYRGKVSVARHLVQSIRKVFRALHLSHVYMMSRNARASGICQKLGDAFKLDCEHFIVKVR